jgi:hypothetical protein
MTQLKKWFQNLGLAALSLALALLMCEGVLRVYKPFHFRVRLGKIELLTNIRFQTDNHEISKLNRVFVYRDLSTVLASRNPSFLEAAGH